MSSALLKARFHTTLSANDQMFKEIIANLEAAILYIH